MITKSDGELLRGGGRVQGLRDGHNECQDEERCTCPLGLGGPCHAMFGGDVYQQKFSPAKYLSLLVARP